MYSRLFRPAANILGSCGRCGVRESVRWRATLPAASYEQTLLNVPPTQLTMLDNGLRVASEDTGLPTATVGVWIDAGSRYESPSNNGVGHFLEHMAFKGTAKRSQADLELEIENMGAHLCSYTGREQSAIYAECLSTDVPRAVEILSDVVQNRKFDEAEIERQKGVILRELEEVEGDLKQVTLDHLHETAFQGTSLAQPVYGRTANIRSFTQNDLVDYVTNHYKAQHIVLAGAGGVDHSALVKLAEEHFGSLESTKDAGSEKEASMYTGSDVRDRDDAMPLVHVAVALEGVSWKDPDYIPMMLAGTLVGSWERTHGGHGNLASKLAQLSAKHDLVHSFESFSISYSDSGLWGIYFISDRMKADDFIEQLTKEWMRLCSSMTRFELERAKNMLRTKLLLQLEGTTQVCADIGRQYLSLGRRIPFPELNAQIQKMDVESVREACYNYLYDKCPVVAAVGPCEGVTDYNRLRSSLYLLRL